MFLTATELRDLTGKRRNDAQERELRHLGIPYRRRKDGTLIVIRTDLHTALIGQPKGPSLRFSG